MQKGEAALQDLITELQAMSAPYTIDRFISSGSYGAVCAGTDIMRRQPVAVKRVFTTVSDGKVVNILSDSFLAKRVVREVKLLCHFNHPNILGLRDVFASIRPQQSDKNKLYLVTELMKTDLAQVLADRRIELTPEHIQYYMYHVLLGLRTLHAAGVIHRDLHPGNILLSQDNDVKICDFNLAREDSASDDKTHYVTHRWYRAPELVMQYRGFTKVVDVWSAGCIMAELYNRKALFRGSTFYNQLNKIVEVVGTPTEQDIAAFASDSAKQYLNHCLSNVRPVPWERVCPNADPVALDLLSKLLKFNPADRISAEAALQHPFFASLFDPMDLTESQSPAFHFDDSITEVPRLHQILMEEVERARQAREAQHAAFVEQQQQQQQAQAVTEDGADPQGSPSKSSVAPSAHPHAGHMPRTASSMSFLDMQ